MPVPLSPADLDGYKAKVCIDFMGLLVRKPSGVARPVNPAASPPKGKAAGAHSFSSGRPRSPFVDNDTTSTWIDEAEEEKDISMAGRYLYVTPIISSLACLEEFVAVLGASNVYVVVYGKSCQREKNWLDYNNLWSLGLKKENLLICAQQADVGRLLESKGIAVFFSTSPEAIMSAAETLTPTPQPVVSGGGTRYLLPPSSAAPLPPSTPLLLGLFRGQGVATSLLSGMHMEKYPSSIRCVYNAFEDSDLNDLKDQWACAMKLMAEKGLPQISLRPFESKTIHWMTSTHAEDRKVPGRESAHGAAGRGERSSGSTGMGGKAEEEADEATFTWWRLLHGAIFQEEAKGEEEDSYIADGSCAPESGPMFTASEDLLFYEGDRPNWTWLEVFGQLFHSDNTVAISTVCGCKDEKDPRSRFSEFVQK